MLRGTTLFVFRPLTYKIRYPLTQGYAPIYLSLRTLSGELRGDLEIVGTLPHHTARGSLKLPKNPFLFNAMHNIIHFFAKIVNSKFYFLGKNIVYKILITNILSFFQKSRKAVGRCVAAIFLFLYISLILLQASSVLSLSSA